MGRVAMEISRIRDNHPVLGTKEQCVEEHRKLVLKIANYYENRTSNIVDIEDLISEGYFGLLLAFDRFDPINKPGKEFSTYAVPYIKGYIIRYLQSKICAIRTPFHFKGKPKLVVSMDRNLLRSDNEDLNFSNILPINDDITLIDVDDFIDSLTESEQTVTTMMIDGYTNSEAAEVLNVSKNTITNMKGRIRKKYILQES